ncbi:MAG: type III pantothenate kinase [Desulfofustis sp.]|jgi:type III pantothenate kinase|nr:type III pantothenate kinase [Desulfofustis sp.]
MILVIDIGNTHTVAGIIDDETILHKWRVKTDAAMTADELAIQFHNLFSLASLDTTRIGGVVLASVVPQLDSAYHQCCASLCRHRQPAEIITVSSDTVASIVTVKLEHPAEIGADRLVNAIGAFDRCRSNAVVIDFGTAITFDCISGKCEYLGGMILPGMHVAISALSSRTAKLPQIDLHRPPDKVIGTSTVSAMKSGLMFGYGEMIEGLIKRVRNEMEQQGYLNPHIFATGGMASVLIDLVPSIHTIDPDLTLRGLSIIHRKLSRR